MCMHLKNDNRGKDICPPIFSTHLACHGVKKNAHINHK